MVEKIANHTHNGIDSPLLANSPQSSLTMASAATLSSGGALSLTTADFMILNNALIRIAELEEKLQNLGFIE